MIVSRSPLQWCCLLLMIATVALPSPAEDPDWKVGAASVAITPEQPLWMGGYASRKKPSEGKVHDLFAKAIWMEDGEGNRCVIVTTDLLGITAELRTAVESQLQKDHGLSSGQLLINASHTHCGPEIRELYVLRRGGGAKFAAKARTYTRWLASQIGKSVSMAIENARPATLHYSFARAGFAMNRRLPTENGVINSPYPEGPVDHRVPVLRAVDGSGKLFAILFGYACHNTTLGFQLFCGDYAGFAQQYLEASHPEVTALFLAGCGGDQNPYPRRTLDLAQQHGRALHNAVQVALETKSSRQIHGPIASVLETVTLRFATPPSREQLQQMAAGGGVAGQHAGRLLETLDQRGSIPTDYEFPIQLIKIGQSLTLVALCGEAVVDYSLRLQSELQTPHRTVWVAGYSNHVFGYLPSQRIVQEGGYEGARAMLYTDYPGPFEPSVENRVIDKVKELDQRLEPVDR